MAPPDPGPAPRWVAGSSFLLESAALSRSVSGGAEGGSAAAAARLGLAERNDAGVTLLRTAQQLDPVQRAAQAGEAVEAFREVVEGCEAALGSKDPDTLIAAGNQAVALVWSGQARTAVSLIEQNWAARVSAFGDNHRLSLDARDALGTGLRLVGRPTEAAAVHAQVCNQRALVLGAQHPDTLVSHLGLALDVADTGDFVGAAAELDQLLLTDVALGYRHPLTVAIRVAAAEVACELGRFDHAVALLEQACSALEATYGPTHGEAVALRAELRAVAAERYAQPS